MPKYRDYNKIILTYQFSCFVAKKANVKIEDAWEVIETMLAIIKERLSEGEEVHCKSHGYFILKFSKPKPHHNPYTGEKWVSKGYFKPGFKHADKLFGNERALKWRKNKEKGATE